MTTTNGNRKNVMNRWGEDTPGVGRKSRGEFNGTPQFTFDDLYISPLTHRRVYDEAGRRSFVPLERNLAPTGIRVLDAYLQALASGKMEAGEFCARYGAKPSDLDGLFFLLTGMSVQDFRARWTLRCADELLRYTNFTVADIARRSGAGSRNNLYFIYERDCNTSPTQRRRALRRDGDLGRFGISDKRG